MNENANTGESEHDSHSHLPTHPGWEPLPDEHLPRPNFFPSGAAMGTAFIFWSIVTSPVIFFIGVALFAASLAGWISEMRRHERKYHS